MFQVFFTTIFTVSFSFCFAQNIDTLATIPLKLSESSGLLLFNNKLYTHNDSGNDAAIYCINKASAQIEKTVFIKNHCNIDWEDMAQDQDYIYVADIGNNLGNRTNLAIIKLEKTDLLNANDLDSIPANKLYFSYEDQNDFTPANQNTAFDAEALVSVGDSLYIFTKDWVTEQSSIYVLDKYTSTQLAKKRHTFNVQGLITGATHNTTYNNVMLCGYTKSFTNFCFEIKSFSASSFDQSIVLRKEFIPTGSTQIEAIASDQENEYFLSAEKFLTAKAYLHKLVFLNNLQSTSFLKKEVIFFPNPSNDFIYTSQDILGYEIFNTQGKSVLKGNKNTIDISPLHSGTYYIELYTKDKHKRKTRFIKP